VQLSRWPFQHWSLAIGNWHTYRNHLPSKGIVEKSEPLDSNLKSTPPPADSRKFEAKDQVQALVSRISEF
jgi:hypothetical protein